MNNTIKGKWKSPLKWTFNIIPIRIWISNQKQNSIQVLSRREKKNLFMKIKRMKIKEMQWGNWWRFLRKFWKKSDKKNWKIHLSMNNPFPLWPKKCQNNQYPLWSKKSKTNNLSIILAESDKRESNKKSLWNMRIGKNSILNKAEWFRIHFIKTLIFKDRNNLLMSN